MNAKFSKNYFFKPSYAQFVSLKTNNSIFKHFKKLLPVADFSSAVTYFVTFSALAVYWENKDILS